jgi:hypothetical protein
VSLFGAGGFVLGGLAPGAAVAIAAAGAAALTALYLLRLRRRRVVVPFAPLWLPHAGERRSERLARRLRRWLSLALQLTIFALLLVAAADPRPAAADRAGRSVVVLVDRSASMSATDEPGTRLAAARARARAVVDGLGSADRALVASFAADVVVETGFEADTSRLRRAVAAIAPSEEPADLGRALAFASAMLRGRPHPTLILVSDGAFSSEARAAAGPVLDGIDARYVAVGRRARNVGILAFAARRYPADPTSVEAALTLQNFGPTAVEARLEIRTGATGAIVERVSIPLGPGERRRHVLPDVAAPDTRLEARLIDGGGDSAGRGDGDDLALDDHAYAVVPGLQRRRVLRVGASNLYLDGALLSLGTTVEVRHVRAAQAERTRASWPSYDAVILDGVAPAPTPEAGRFLYLDPHGAGSPFPDRGVVRGPVISDARRTHPLLRELDLTDVNIAEARRLALGRGDLAVASSFGAPLVLARERPGLRVAALAFDVRRSDLPMRAAFPLLVANALMYLGGADARESPAALTGATVRVPVARGATEVDVEEPDGRKTTWPAAADYVEIPIARAGFYRVGTGHDGIAAIAANLGDAVESNTAPAPTLVVGGARELPPPDAPAAPHRQPIAALVLLGAAALLLVEWWSYHRRWTV